VLQAPRERREALDAAARSWQSLPVTHGDPGKDQRSSNQASALWRLATGSEPGTPNLDRRLRDCESVCKNLQAVPEQASARGCERPPFVVTAGAVAASISRTGRLAYLPVGLEFVVRRRLGAGRGPCSERPSAHRLDRQGPSCVDWRRPVECGPPTTRGRVPHCSKPGTRQASVPDHEHSRTAHGRGILAGSSRSSARRTGVSRAHAARS
jgi:hypothetical protein